MGLRDIITPTSEIVTPGGRFSVRGLSLSDIIFLTSRHRDVVDFLFRQIGNRSPEDIGLDDASSLGAELMRIAPAFVAQMIALASDDNTSVGIEAAHSLPIEFQLEAVNKIGQLTFSTDDSLKKVMRSLISMQQGSMKALKSL